jgi:putative hydrolase of the HAD superfamily
MPRGDFEAVLFDYGGVFVASPFSAADEYSEKLGLSPEKLLGIVFGPYDRDTEHPWHRMERGEIAIEQAREEIFGHGREHGVEVDLFEFFGAIGSIANSIIEPMVDCVRGLKAHGYRTAIVTNNLAEFSEHWRKTLPLDELFDTVVDSSQVGMRKPNPRIFELALERLGEVKAERAVFLDDFPGNVEAARRLGMAGILVEADPSGALAELRRILGE